MASGVFNPLEYIRSRSNSPNIFPDVYDLSYMDLEVTALDDELANDSKKKAQQIVSLILSNNLLVDLPPSLNNFANIETLDLSNNQLKEINFDTRSLTNLRFFMAKNNLLSDTSLPKDFGDQKLEIVNLSGNQFEQFPYQLLNVSTMKEIYLGSNQISVLPRNFENLKNLEIMYLGGNMLKSIPEEISQLKNLSSLNLSDNMLTTLPTKLVLLRHLRTLSLHGNYLTTLPVDLVKLNINELSLRNNPLVNRFAKEYIYEVPSLLELSARTIKTKDISFGDSYLPKHLEQYLDSAQCCLNPKCSGVYFTSRVQHVKFVDFCGKFRIPLMQYLCSSTCNEKISNKSRLNSDSFDSNDEYETNDSTKLRKILIG